MEREKEVIVALIYGFVGPDVFLGGIVQNY